MRMKLPPRGKNGIPIEKLKCPKCKKPREELDPKDCTDPDCPNKLKE